MTHSNYKKVEIGNFDDVVNVENGKIFLKDTLELTSCEISINSVPKGFKLPFRHKHKQNEEMYIILKGSGTITIDNEAVPVKKGSIVKILPAASRTIENTGSGIFSFICVQAKSNSLEQFGLSDGEMC